MNIVCKLGDFHTITIFLGSIGSMMKVLGLEEALETVNGHNVVTYVISGKAVSRALRGHFLIEAALMNKMMLSVLPCIHADNQNDTVNLSRETQEIIEESFLGQGNSNDMYSKEKDILTGNSFEISHGAEISLDEAVMDLDLQDKLDAAEVEKIRSLYEGIEDKLNIMTVM